MASQVARNVDSEDIPQILIQINLGNQDEQDAQYNQEEQEEVALEI